jgi:hypothetical protein
MQLGISKNKMELFSEFHDTLCSYSESLSGSTHILLKMHHLWGTFQSFFEPTKVAKNKKSKALNNYEQTVKEL